MESSTGLNVALIQRQTPASAPLAEQLFELQSLLCRHGEPTAAPPAQSLQLVRRQASPGMG
jgi:hypothetical protein